MNATANSALGLWAGKVLLEYCPYEKAHCELCGCWPAALCRAARGKQPTGLWEHLVIENRRETLICAILAASCLLVIVLAFLWPHLHS